ncbi:nuclear transport factor 2 family protein [Pontibacter silvestris]|uniref:Nuclear transport factor 2 family protein n=1 Tax=Pontibacter silvestris TaxID=2305183 RepID=A0ABW4X1Z4_9BACT|nr:nuclear transport factor 2 family protein [Pontibacter silvestris]MCC9138698.1 nuclear transport factor 2 family protein [Pontibacter silvestris]
MNLPKVIADLVAAQDNYDSAAYAKCFSETAVVVDEGKAYSGRNEIRQWTAEANEKYRTAMKPISLSENGPTSVLTAEISGSFPGSPAVLDFHFELKDGLIHSLRIIN